MKKYTPIAGAAAAMLALSACSNASSETPSQAENAEAVVSVENTLFGMADTNNKSMLKKTVQKTHGPGDIEIYHYDENGKRVAYPEGTVVDGQEVTYQGSVVFSLESDEPIDDTKIDSSNAVVKLVEGDGYFPDELVLKANTLLGEWKDGKTEYTLESEDLSWTLKDYPVTVENSGKEWSVFGGDGNGIYNFNFEISGIQYDGKKLDPVELPILVYIYGRDATDMGAQYAALGEITVEEQPSGKESTQDVQIIWQGEGEKPSLADHIADNFYVIWKKDGQEQELTKDDVTLTLTSEHDESKVLDQNDYEIFNHEGESQIALKYHNWASTPVYDKLTIDVKAGDEQLSETFEIGAPMSMSLRLVEAVWKKMEQSSPTTSTVLTISPPGIR